MKMFCLNYLLKNGDPVVESKIGNYYLKHSYSHKLPFYLRDFPEYGIKMVNIANEVLIKYKDLKIIDVGANIGDSVALIKSVINVPILCIDGDEIFFSLLKENTRQFNNVVLEKVMLSDHKKMVNVNFHGLGGTSHIEENGKLSDFETLDLVLKRNKEFMHSRFIKVDTDGYDGYVLGGAEKYLSAVKPVIFFEYDPYFLNIAKYKPMDIFKLLIHYGYIYALIYDNTGKYICNLKLNNHKLLLDLTTKIDNNNGQNYYDICVFCEADKDLFEKLRQNE
jgi:FkbM family methyltransferase